MLLGPGFPHQLKKLRGYPKLLEFTKRIQILPSIFEGEICKISFIFWHLIFLVCWTTIKNYLLCLSFIFRICQIMSTKMHIKYISIISFSETQLQKVKQNLNVKVHFCLFEMNLKQKFLHWFQNFRSDENQTNIDSLYSNRILD